MPRITRFEREEDEDFEMIDTSQNKKKKNQSRDMSQEIIDTSTVKQNSGSIIQTFQLIYFQSNQLSKEETQEEFDQNTIPPEIINFIHLKFQILERYFGPQNLFLTSMSKTEQNVVIEFNRVLKETYFTLFHQNTITSIAPSSYPQTTSINSQQSKDVGFPQLFLNIPMIQDLKQVFEQDLSAFKFQKVQDFESFIDTILLVSLQTLQECNRAKQFALKSLKQRVREVYLMQVENLFRGLTKEEQIAFFVQNQESLVVATRKSTILKNKLINQLSFTFRNSFNECLSPFRDYMDLLPPEALKTLTSLHEELLIDDKIPSLDFFIEHMNQFYKQMFDTLHSFVWFMRHTMIKMKRSLLEYAVALLIFTILEMYDIFLNNFYASILEDVERLPNKDRDLFMASHQQLLEKSLMDTELINFKVYDIDLLIEKQREMVRNLHQRDLIWFQHFRD